MTTVLSYPHPGDDWIIGPAARLLATTRFGRHDSSLMDECIDWIGVSLPPRTLWGR